MILEVRSDEVGLWQWKILSNYDSDDK